MTAIRNHEIAPDFAVEEKRYLNQLIERTELLEFVGIPDPRQNAAIKLEDIFVPLGAEEEIEFEEKTYAFEFKTSRADAPKSKENARSKGTSTPDVIFKTREPLPHKTTRRVTLDDALRSHARLMILGDPGAGKSTLLRYLTLGAARGLVETLHASPRSEAERDATSLHEPPLPIPIPLRRFAASNQSLIEFFYMYTKQTLQIELTRGLFEHALDNGRCIVLFDGLDEVFVSDQRVAVRDAVAAFANRYGHNNRIIVTSRVVGYESAPLDRRAFAHHTILPFTDNEIESFVNRWYAARERVPEQAQAQAEQLWKTVKEGDRLRKLAENPLMLTIIALVHRVEAELPNERVKLYDKCTESLLSTWEGVKGLAHDRERTYFKHRRRLLEKLAFWMHAQSQEAERQAEVKRGDLKAQLMAFLLEDPKLNLSADLAELEAEAFIELAKSRTGILIERGDGIYSFVHLTFQEYFSACDLEKRYITDLERLWQEIQPHLYDPRWREVILLLLGRLNEHDEPPSVLVEKILREHDKFDEVVHRNLFLAAQCLADRVNVREALRNEIVDALLKFARGNALRFGSLQKEAIQMLGMLSNEKSAHDGLMVLMQGNDFDSSARFYAAEALLHLGHADTVVHFLLQLAQDHKVDLSIRRSAIRSLGRYGGDNSKVIDVILAQAQDIESNAAVQNDLALALKQLGHTQHAVQMQLRLAADKESLTLSRVHAAETLGALGESEIAMRHLLALAHENNEDSFFLVVIAEALGRLGYFDHLHDVIAQLLTMAKNKSGHGFQRKEAIQMIGELGHYDNPTIEGLLDLYEDRDEPRPLRLMAAQTLARLGYTNQAILESLLRSLENPKVESEIQIEIADALSRIKRADYTAILRIVEISKNESLSLGVRRYAARSLTKLGHTDLALDSFLAIARESIKSKRQVGVSELGEFGHNNPSVAISLLEFASDKEANTRDTAYSALKEVVGNLRYAEVSKEKGVARKQKIEIPGSTRNDKTKNRKSKIRNHK